MVEKAVCWLEISNFSFIRLLRLCLRCDEPPHHDSKLLVTLILRAVRLGRPKCAFPSLDPLLTAQQLSPCSKALRNLIWNFLFHPRFYLFSAFRLHANLFTSSLSFCESHDTLLSSIKSSDAVRFTNVEIPFKKLFCGRCTSGTRRPITQRDI